LGTNELDHATSKVIRENEGGTKYIRKDLKEMFEMVWTCIMEG
jgi:hypothetical protein